MKIPFLKMQGCGNDFVVIDATQTTYALSPEMIRHIANRQQGIGCDQVLLVAPTHDDTADFDYIIFNQDGSEAGQCGNGARCLAHFIELKGLSSKKVVTLATKTIRMTTEKKAPGQFQVTLPPPDFSAQSIPMQPKAPLKITLDEMTWDFHIAHVGNPHMMVLHNQPLPDDSLCQRLSTHPYFKEGINVSFASIPSHNKLTLNVYERGAGWTQACGSAACACACIAIEHHGLGPMVEVSQPGGSLIIEWQGKESPIKMTGPSTVCFEGYIDL